MGKLINGEIKNEILKINHYAGFYSTCSALLHNLIFYYKEYKKLPKDLDLTYCFEKYRQNNNKNVYPEYFKNFKNINVNFNKNNNVNFTHNLQFSDYSKLDFNNISPFIEKYFTPSDKVNNHVQSLLKKYNIDYENTIAVYYRGTDKKRETNLGSYNDFYIKIKEIMNKNNFKKILIQTDCSQFIDYINEKKIKNIIIKENHTTYLEKGIHNIRGINNHNDMFYLLSTFLIISKCKFVIFNTGNCSLWINLFRKSNKNIFQNVNGKWINC